jgi:hypothetical protein
MTDRGHPSLGVSLLFRVVLYVLASPIYLLSFLLRNVRRVAGFVAARRGEIVCPHCATANPTDVLATCRRCGATEFGSRFYCSNCHEISTAFPCSFCHATIRVL